MFYNKNHKALGHYLKIARVEAGLSQGVVAENLGYTVQFISNAERGRSSLPLGALSKVIRMYNVESQQIISLLLEQEKEFLEKTLIKAQLQE